MTKEYLENILTEYGVAFTDSLADRLLKEFEPCEDAISRQAALDCFTATKLKKFDFILYAREEIKKLPPVNPTKTGHWIHRKMANEFWEECSECHVERAYPTLYCPDCGCRMG